MINLAINGFGRIGRVALRAILTKYLDRVKPVAINTSGSMEAVGWAHLLEYDSVYGQFKGKISLQKGSGEEIGVMLVNNQRISLLAQREPAKIPWKQYAIGVVLETTGVFRERKLAAAHLDAGAKKVVISATANGVKPYIMGVNQQNYQGELMVSNASCTTNCVAPLAKIMMETLGIQKALLSTIHAYTADQSLVDDSHHDLRRARAAAVNIIPTSTGADEATVELLPGLQGLFDGMAYRVPTPGGSVVDLTLLTVKRTSKQAVNQILTAAAAAQYRGIVAVTDKPLVSRDIVGNAASALVDLSLTQVVDGDLIKVVAWYDNEWAYCCRLIELAEYISKK
ncbi:type I glyceraldehyde-3-phosphate dehydrogenase [Candidatus Shapirobacteria bacterium CG09_land_8_20_14_0_10_49_15]|uniref:Type I glyceraldehyde-3-phosphate dehydrogenase n=2 Tax=Candidatus Shapironibacteriota TaxID=1752721 RepID=A0A2M8L7V1_9BACT|nr:MAG: type I glyceraldehyde-3-phosphate dehydrogenase [Candidatus Shapirobacteria bacterium CG09_land_8_20_14_0_10_49_15]PJE70314.1 MAG: type I glyceraldehyde-3-phosphate dehydrogenase [Candidatus Shapirobacteria bacterium CG10_big_fil_rev_8_21_14_0_10_48_15]